VSVLAVSEVQPEPHSLTGSQCEPAEVEERYTSDRKP
jgi:hypothetical protein